VIAAAACAHAPPQPMHGVSTIVRADVERAETAERARRHDLARTEYERAITDAHDPDSIAFARHEYADTLEHWGEYDAMIAQLEAIVAVRPDDAGAWHDLGFLYFKLRHDDARAIAALERAEQLAPRVARSHVELAEIYWCTGDRARAADEYRALLALELPDKVRAAARRALELLAGPATAPPHCS
jgi:tetratricopeptide (TPR) repeat protein